MNMILIIILSVKKAILLKITQKNTCQKQKHSLITKMAIFQLLALKQQ